MVVCCPCHAPAMVCPAFLPAASVYAGSSSGPDLEKGREVEGTQVPLLSKRQEIPPELGFSEFCECLCFIVLLEVSMFLFFFALADRIQLPVLPLFWALIGINGFYIFMMWWRGTVICSHDGTVSIK